MNIDENNKDLVKIVKMLVKKNPQISRKIIGSFREKQDIRIEAGTWEFSDEDLSYEKQLENINLFINNEYKTNKNNYLNIMIRQIERKIYGYKKQDMEKNIFNEDKFINLTNIVDKIYECNMICYYCHCKMSILYTIVREGCQWTVDRINNDLGHNIDNYVLACLDCNLKRRCRSSDKFLFTKQLNLVKIDNEINETNET